jgi:hypothetical protein
MTIEEYRMLEFGSQVVSHIDGTIWRIFAANPHNVSLFKEVHMDMWGRPSYPDKIVFPYNVFLDTFDAPFSIDINGKKQFDDSFVKTGGKEGEPYSIVYPNFHMIEGDMILPF